jgi:hypothetical protein
LFGFQAVFPALVIYQLPELDNKLRRIKGLYQIILSSCLQGFHGVLYLPVGGDHDHRNGDAPVSYPGKQFLPVYPRQL